MRILTSKDHREERLEIAERALKTFVKFSPKLYSPRFVSFNIHALLHLVDDARLFGSLDDCSTFMYENNNNFLKKLIRNHPKPLEQLANRLKERSYVQHKVKKIPTWGAKVSVPFHNGPVPQENDQCLQFKKYESELFQFSINGSDNYCQTNDGSICQIENIIVIENVAFFYVSKFDLTTDFFEKPIKSSLVGIYKCSKLNRVPHLICATNVVAKCYKMPSYCPSFSESKERTIEKDTYIFATMIHTEKQ